MTKDTRRSSLQVFPPPFVSSGHISRRKDTHGSGCESPRACRGLHRLDSGEGKPATAHNRHREWRPLPAVARKGETRASPMDGKEPPRRPEEPPPVFREAELRAIFAACRGDKTSAGRRDEAILRVSVDTGARRAEELILAIPDVDLGQGLIKVTGKAAESGRFRLVPKRCAHSTATSAREGSTWPASGAARRVDCSLPRSSPFCPTRSWCCDPLSQVDHRIEHELLSDFHVPQEPARL